MADVKHIESVNQIYLPPSSFEGLTAEEQAVLAVVQTELQGWNEQDVDKVLSVMADDAVYWDVTMEPAVGMAAIRQFGEDWVAFCPDFGVHVEKLVTQGNMVANMGYITGHPNPGVEWFPGKVVKEGAYMEFPYFQLAMVKDGKIHYVRDHWNSAAIENIFA
jgi:limonene-1,2-epoxide hydrolase